jgi:hypothetical protein
MQPHTPPPDTAQVEVIVLDEFTFALEERAAHIAGDHRAEIAWRVRKMDQRRRLRELALEFGVRAFGQAVLIGDNVRVVVEIAAPHAMSLNISPEQV